MGRKRTKMIPATELSLKLSELRRLRGLSRDQLGEKVEVSATYIGMLESGERQPSRELVLKLGQVFFSPQQSTQIDTLLLLAGFSPIHAAMPSTPKDPIELRAEAAEADQANFQAFSAWIMALLKSGHFEEAQRALQTGFQRFSAHIPLQSLLAMLELSKAQYAEAIASQTHAIHCFLQQSSEYVKLADLKLNLGEMYFMKALTEENTSQAVLDLEAACEQLAQALELAPEDIYIRDEYARASFNLAGLLTGDAAQKQWQHCIECFHQVLAAPNQQLLGNTVLKEASVFLALAYAKRELFPPARLGLQIVAALSPDYWLVYYVQAVCKCLEYQQTSDPDCLQAALQDLKKAAILPDPQNRTLAEAYKDPDFEPLRQHYFEQFQEILNQHPKESDR